MIKKRPRVLDIDDGGSFDRLVEETCLIVTGSTDPLSEAAKDLLEFRVLRGFVIRMPKDKNNNKFEKETQESIKKTGSSSSCDADVDDDDESNIVSENGWEANHKKKKPKKKEREKKSSFAEKGLEPPRLSSKLEKRIAAEEGTDIKIVIMKTMFKTDLNEHHDRITIPLKQVRNDSFLTQEEKRILANEKSELCESKKDKGELTIHLMEPCGNHSSMVLTKWKLKTTESYALRTSWKDVLQRNHINEKYFDVNDIIQIWSFRVKGELWFAIDKVWDVKTSSLISDSCED